MSVHHSLILFRVTGMLEPIPAVREAGIHSEQFSSPSQITVVIMNHHECIFVFCVLTAHHINQMAID